MRSHDKNGSSTLSVFRSSERIELFWELLVAYANSDSQVPRRWAKLGGIEALPAHTSSFDRVTHLLLASELISGLPSIGADVNPYESGDPADRTDDIFHGVSNQLRRHHEMFNKTLSWLCSPKIRKVPAGRIGALTTPRYLTMNEEDEPFIRYLETHGVRSVKRRVRVVGFSKKDRRMVLYVEWWRNPIDPFCVFLLEQCVGRPSGELRVKLCARRSCGRFFLPVRNTAKFCSDSCRATKFWTPKKRRKYMREWRLKRLSPGTRCVKIMKLSKASR
jgi:hypothetical protein